MPRPHVDHAGERLETGVAAAVTGDFLALAALLLVPGLRVLRGLAFFFALLLIFLGQRAVDGTLCDGIVAPVGTGGVDDAVESAAVVATAELPANAGFAMRRTKSGGMAAALQNFIAFLFFRRGCGRR